MDNVMGQRTKKSRKGLISGIIVAFLIVVLSVFGGMIFEDVGGNDILIVKAIGTGTLHFYKTPGWKWQGGGETTHLHKSFQFWFSEMTDQGDDTDRSIRARFNDNGHGNISGSVRIDSPLTDDKLKAIYTRYGSQEGIEKELIRTVYEKAIYMVGPLMSSTESASSKRNLLIAYIEDQAQNGVFKTIMEDKKTKDPITGILKTVAIVKIMKDANAPGGIARQEKSPLQVMGYTSSNLSINNVKYDKTVEAQIASQQKLIMEVQISMAAAKKAEQNALTVAKEGEALAATAKWKQEAIKAKYVTEAEQKKDVAKLEKEAAAFNKQKNILDGQGEAAKRTLIMESDGALAQKLEVYERVTIAAFAELSKQKWVPEITMGESGSSEGNETGGNVNRMINLITTKVAKDMALDMTMTGQNMK